MNEDTYPRNDPTNPNTRILATEDIRVWLTETGGNVVIDNDFTTQRVSVLYTDLPNLITALQQMYERLAG